MLKAVKKVDKQGNIGYKLRAYAGRDANKKVKIVSMMWKPDSNWSEARIQKELELAQFRFQEEVDSQIKLQNDALRLNTSSSLTFDEFCVKYIEEYAKVALKTRTLRDYESRLKRIKPAIGHIMLKDFTPSIINRFLANLSEDGVKLTVKQSGKPSGLSPKSIKNYKILLSSIFSCAVEWGFLESSPMKGIVTPKAITSTPTPLSSEEVKKLIQCLDENAPLKYYVFITLDIITGMRRGELLGLTWDKINFKNQLITINSALLYTPEDGVYVDTTKTESSNRVIHISEWLNNLLKIYHQEYLKTKKQKHQEGLPDWNQQEYLFFQDNGKPMHPNTPYNWFINFQKKHNLRVVNIHTLRHTTATLLIANQVNTKLVSGRLGHSSTKTTNDIYANYIKEADEAVSEILDDIILPR